MSKDVKTVTELWKEYDQGLPNSYPLRYIETGQYTFQDDPSASSSKNRKFFQRRLPIIQFIKELHRTRGWSCEEAAERLEEYRSREVIGLQKLGERIKQKTDAERTQML